MLRQILGCIIFVLAISPVAISAEAERPRVNDNRLKLELFAEHPQVVTPTGLAVDQEGRIFVIESHTHKRPSDYEGPKHDRILLLEDTDDQPGADRGVTYFKGLTHAMQLAFHPDGPLYAVTRDRVLQLRAPDNDCQAEEAREVLSLNTPAGYPHNGLSGIAFDSNGGLYIGLGENHNAPFSRVGSDGREITASDGSGRVFHCGKDGRRLGEVAQGLWNPFGLAVDMYGRVFATDNDPGDRPPCRLIHVVEGGNYGYQRRYQSGFHPFNAWDGELPGTLPMIGGTAEAPTGLIAYESKTLPSEYTGTLMLGSWADHRIEVHTPNREGASLTADRQTLVQGGLHY